MLYFTDEVFRRLANQNRGHVCVMSECRIKINYVCTDFISDSITKITSNKGRRWKAETHIREFCSLKYLIFVETSIL